MVNKLKRVHVDPFGNVHLCQGLLMRNVFKTPLVELVKNYDPTDIPVVLWQGRSCPLSSKVWTGT